jgi:hypothetical protein
MSIVSPASGAAGAPPIQEPSVGTPPPAAAESTRSMIIPVALHDLRACTAPTVSEDCIHLWPLMRTI